MNFLAMYRASFYLMLTFATLVLSVDATDDNPLAMLYPLVVAFAGALAYFTVDRNPLLSLNRSLASLVALASGALSVAEYQYDNNLLLLAAAHWLVYLQIIKMFLPKTVEDDWFLFLLGLVQVLVGGVISQSDKVGVMLLCWALTSLWVLTLFALRREALRMEPVPFGSSDLVAADRSEPYRGLFDIPFLFATIRVAGITLAMGGLIFLAMPRRMMSGSSNSSDSVGKHLSGFDDEVQLGQLGEILENDSVVMTIDQTDLQGKRIVPVNGGPEDRWRGITLDSYLKGRWKRPKLPITGYTLGFPGYSQNNPVIRQQIKLEPTDSPILFGLRPVVDTDATDKRFMPALNEVDGSLFRGESRAVSIDYQVFSSPDANLAQGGESYPLGDYLARLVEVPPDVLEKIRPVAQEIVKGIDPGDTQARASALQEYLRGPGTGFRYTLAMDVVDPSLDPAVDFILNRKQGHCEYFATALTLLARSVGLPARMVNGFKGGDYNAMSGLTTVRQKHAHSWVEVLVDRDPSNEFKAFWITFDPTPADQRNASVAQVGGMAGNFREITDYIRYIWVFYVVGFNAERQDRFLYRPIRILLSEAMNGFKIIGETLRVWLHFPSSESFFSLRGFLVSFVGLLLLAWLFRLMFSLVRALWRVTRGGTTDLSSQAVGDSFYRRLLHLLEGTGMTRPIAETPREFARRAAQLLAGEGSGNEVVADVPPLVVDAFYRSRFGDHPLSEPDQILLIARLDALEARLNPVTT